MPRTAHPDLRAACADEALRVIQKDGPEALSLRDVARRLGVSHQAPYRHFENRDALMAEVVRRSFASFAAHLTAATANIAEGREALRAMGVAYLAYAEAEPARYRLMFGTPLPASDRHPEMLAASRHAFDLLRAALAKTPLGDGDARPSGRIDADALFIWSALHGLVSILAGDAFETIALAAHARASAVEEVLNRIGPGLAVGYDTGQRSTAGK